jgi:hypothetical protein
MRKKLTLDICQNFVKSRNGSCLSTEYENNHTKMLWQCESNNIQLIRIDEKDWNDDRLVVINKIYDFIGNIHDQQ